MEKLKEMLKKFFALKGRNPDQFVIGAWIEVLQRFDEKLIAKALNACLQKEGFFEIKLVLDELTPNRKELSLDAWDKCMQVAKDGGRGLDKLDDNVLNALQMAGGIHKLRTTESDYVRNMMKKDFSECYEISEKKQDRLLIKCP